MPRSSRSRSVRALLRARFRRVQSLSAFARGLDPDGCRLLRPGDPAAFRELLARCLVCEPWGAAPPPERPSFRQESDLKELVARVLQQLCRRGGDNVLATGFAPPDSARDAPPLPGTSGVCRLRPNSGTDALRGSAAWALLLRRLGDRVLEHLLAQRALFLLAPPSCAVQLSGPPLHRPDPPRAPPASDPPPPPPPPPPRLRARRLLYSAGGERVPGSFALSRLPPSLKGARALLAAVFLPAPRPARPRLPARLRRLAPLFRRLLANHVRCPYGALLRALCPRPPLRGPAPLPPLLRAHSSPWRVYLLLRACLRRLVPARLWGSRRNLRRFLRTVRRLLRLGRHGALTRAQLMWRVRVRDCAWLRAGPGQRAVSAQEHRRREATLAAFLWWLLDTCVVGLLRAFFYVTETTFQKNRLLFYRKSVWAELQGLALRQQVLSGQLREPAPEELRRVRAAWPGPASKLRFLPKPSGLRPIVSAPRPLDAQARRLAWRVRVLFEALNCERARRPHLLGASVLGLDGVLTAWRRFKLRAHQRDPGRPLWFVKVDVSGAFDSLSRDKLVEVVARALRPADSSYCVRRYALVRGASGRACTAFRTHVCTPEELCPTLLQFAEQLQAGGLRDSVLVEQSLSLHELGSDLFDFFLRLLCNHVLQVGGRCYMQSRGVPQGSVLSTLLCSLCYGDMEARLFPHLQRDGLLLRLVDDFLLVTPHLADAKAFLSSLVRGIPEYGCMANLDKTVVNFPLAAGELGPAAPLQLPAHCCFPWCGLLLDTRSLDVRCDYTSYAHTSMKLSLTFSPSGAPGRSLCVKLSRLLRLKCHGLFLDLQVNSLHTVCENLYHVFLLQAYRLHACVLQLPFGQTVSRNPAFFLRLVSRTAAEAHTFLRDHNRDKFQGKLGPLPEEATHWLCRQAFLSKFSQHLTTYSSLLQALRADLGHLRLRLPVPTLHTLEAVSSPGLSVDFSGIID